MFLRRNLARITFGLVLLSFLTLALAACGDSTPTTAATSQATTSSTSTTAANPDTKPLRIGHQKGGSLVLLKAQGTLEKKLGLQVQWIEFPAGPQLLEALNAGSIDIGSTGDSPPVFAQAGGTPLVYVAAVRGNPESQGILVPANSPIKTVADLKGKKVAYNKGSSAHFMLVKALEEAGVKYTDVESVNLPPGDARVAFETGKIDAWVIWDPFFSVARQSTNAKLIRDSKGLGFGRSFYLASKNLATNRTETLKAFLDEIQRVELWSKDNTDEVAKFISPLIGVDLEIQKKISRAGSYGLLPITDEVIADQQKVADTFFQLNLIPKQISIREAAWRSDWTPKS